MNNELFWEIRYDDSLIRGEYSKRPSRIIVFVIFIILFKQYKENLWYIKYNVIPLILGLYDYDVFKSVLERWEASFFSGRGCSHSQRGFCGKNLGSGHIFCQWQKQVCREVLYIFVLNIAKRKCVK